MLAQQNVAKVTCTANKSKVQGKMPLKNVHYQKLETEDSDEGGEDESPPTHVQLGHSPHTHKGNRWNHIDNLDEFFERVYDYQQQNGLLTIVISDILELLQFIFMVLLAAFIVTCLRFHNLWVDTITIHHIVGNSTEERDVEFGDLFDVGNIVNINPVVVIFLLLALSFWLHRLIRSIVRFYRFWEMRRFYTEALNIPSSELRNTSWADVLVKLKQAQRDYKMNIQKQELTELDVYHRILRFKNYMVAMVNKSVLPCKIKVPFYGDKVFLTQGLKFNFELILFWPSLKAPFKNSFYLRDEYKSASKKAELVKNLRFRIGLLALLNLIFCPVIFIYQLLYAFFSYAEIVKREPGTFGKRRWSMYGRLHLRDFNELEHEFRVRLNRAYKPSVKYMDLFTHPLLAVFARNIAFFAGSILAVLLVLTVIQEDLLTAPNILKILTSLGLIVTVCAMFIPNENQVWCPSELMQTILGNIHYMPDHWKQAPHTAMVYKEFTQVFQYTVMAIVDEILSPLLTPFILYFTLRDKAGTIVDFLRNFTIEVSGVGDVCSFAEMNVRKHGSPEWLTAGVSRASDKEQAELGKTEISLLNFSRKNPNWKPSEDGTAFMTQLKESADEMHHSASSQHSGHYGQAPPMESSVTYLSMPPSAMPVSESYSQFPPIPPSQVGQSMEWSIWSIQPTAPHPHTPSHPHTHTHSHPHTHPHILTDSMVGSTLQLHQVHDHQKSQTTYTASVESAWTVQQGDTTQPPISLASYTSESDTHITGPDDHQERSSTLQEPLLAPMVHLTEEEMTVVEIHEQPRD